MRSLRYVVLAGCFFVTVLGSPAAKASGGGTIDGGTITFTGMVVEPTCSVATVSTDVGLAPGAVQVHQPLQRSCSSATATGPTAKVSRPYIVDVVRLSGTEPDRVLRYFENYVRAAQPQSANPQLITQTYE